MQAQIDGFVRLSLDAMLSSPLRHLVSGVDDSFEEPWRACGSPTFISGYTEWASHTEPPISLGWDWTLDTSMDEPRWLRVGYPRSNVMLMHDPCGGEVGWAKNLEVLATVVDALPWKELAQRAITGRYKY